MAIDKLSEDLLMEILSWLPVKTLLQSKSVCKNWYALIQNPSFIYLHHDRAATKNIDCLLVNRFLDGRKHGVTLSLVSNGTPIEDIDLSSTGLKLPDVHILDPCNGVVCLTKICALNAHTVLCNLSMKEYRVLPQPSYKKTHFSYLGFGFVPPTNDYKVVRFAIRSTISIGGFDERVEIYDLSTDSWRKGNAEYPIKSQYSDDCLYQSWNGSLYWCVDAAIMAFSLTDEVFKEMPVPEEVCLLDQAYRYSCKKLFALKDFLSLALYHEVESCFFIWVMDNGVSWTKKFIVGPFSGFYGVLGFRRNSEFLANSCRHMISCNIYTQEVKVCQVHDPTPPFSIRLYTESLVPVKRHNEYDEHLES